VAGRVGWKEGRQHVGRQFFAQHREGDLGVHIAPQVPGHQLAPRNAVDRGPRLGLVSPADQSQNDVLERQSRAGPLRQVRVHALGVSLKHALCLGVHGVPFLLGDACPTQRPQELVGLELAFPEHLGQAPGADVARGVHLPEAVLGVQEPLRHVQVVLGFGIDRWDAYGVSEYLDRMF